MTGESTERDENSADERRRGDNGAHDPDGSRVSADTGSSDFRLRTESCTDSVRAVGTMTTVAHPNRSFRLFPRVLPLEAATKLGNGWLVQSE